MGVAGEPGRRIGVRNRRDVGRLGGGGDSRGRKGLWLAIPKVLFLFFLAA